MEKYILDAVEESIERITTASERGVKSQFLIGAGCSISCGIPSANEILKLIQKKFPISYQKLPLDQRADYRKIIDLLPLNERKELIIEITTGKKVNWGYLALARLMEAGYVSRVLSLNFDHQLQRACSLIGFHPAIYDFAVAPTKDIEQIVSPSIIHLHGQSYGFRQLSNEKETNNHILKISPLLENTFSSSPLFVTGYSGESDEMFKVLEKKYSGKEFLTWMGYDYSAKLHLEKLLKNNHASYWGGVEFDSYMVNLAIKLKCWPPRLVSEPLKTVQGWVSTLADFRPALGQKSLKLQYAANQKLIHLEREWSEKYSKLPKFENDYLFLNYQNIIKKYTRSKNKKEILKSDFHRMLVAWAYSELSHKNWQLALDRKLPKKKRIALLMKSNKYIEESLNLDDDSVRASNKINVEILLYLVTRKERYLDIAILTMNKYGYKKKNKKLMYNIIVAYIEKYKIHKDIGITKTVKKIWTKLKVYDRNMSYNYICYLSIIGEEELCKEELSYALSVGAAPKNKLLNDEDLYNVSGTRWFKSLCKKYDVN